MFTEDEQHAAFPYIVFILRGFILHDFHMSINRLVVIIRALPQDMEIRISPRVLKKAHWG